MDANATLCAARALVARLLTDGDRLPLPDGWTDDALEVLELVAALDEHLSRGGYLPSEWAR